jgi:hypothetical protein
MQVIFAVIYVALFVGWCMNLIDVIMAALGSTHVHVTWLEIAGVVLPPLGGVLGWL